MRPGPSSRTKAITGYLAPEFGDTPVRDIDVARIRQMTDRLDQIPSPLNPKSKFNSISQPVLIALMMILRQTAERARRLGDLFRYDPHQTDP